MKKVFNCILFFLFILSGCDIRFGIIESEFTLAKDSTLPKFINETIEGYTKDDLIITFTFYTPLIPMDRAKILIRGPKPNDKILKEIIGKFCSNEIIIEQEKNPDYLSYPRYICISVNGIEEMFEFKKMEPFLYVSDVSK